MKYIPLGT